MKKMLFSAIAMIAFAGSAFASNEVISDLDLTENLKEEATENSEGVGYNCSTTTYGRYVTHYVNEGIGIMDGKPYYNVTVVYEVTGQCTTCLVMGHNGVGSTTDCWGYGY